MRIGKEGVKREGEKSNDWAQKAGQKVSEDKGEED